MYEIDDSTFPLLTLRTGSPVSQAMLKDFYKAIYRAVERKEVFGIFYRCDATEPKLPRPKPPLILTEQLPPDLHEYLAGLVAVMKSTKMIRYLRPISVGLTKAMPKCPIKIFTWGEEQNARAWITAQIQIKQSKLTLD
ncbi:MAG: hypothetical protein RML35_13350 [Chloroherpetonaceae bacterium]|nr:hypothetical protein [Chloroherpetonaceae bacterium]